jgi:hypothetical protein
MNTEKEKETEHFKLIICVMACATIQTYKDEILKIEETWGKRAIKKNVKVLYFLGEEQTDLKDDLKYIYLKNVKNDYYSATDKQNLGLKFIHENYNADFIFCCGTDTYINIDNMLKYINDYDYNKFLYIGGHGDIRIINNKNYFFHCGGAGFIISNASLDAIFAQLVNIKIEWQAICVNNNCENLISACDVGISYYLQNIIGSELQIIEDKKAFFGCNYKGIVHHKNVGLYFTCCNNIIEWPTLISCHCMSPLDFDEFTKILEDNNYYATQ